MPEHVCSFRGGSVVVSYDAAAPNVLYLDRQQPIVLAPVSHDLYVIYQGRVRLGDIVFHDGPHRWGWCYYPRSNRLRPSRKLHLDVLAAIRRRLRPDIIVAPTIFGAVPSS